MKLSLRILLLCFLLGPAILQAQTSINGSFIHGGILREYILYVPAIYNASTPVPIVLNLHGYTSNNQQQQAYGDFRSIADTANFIIIHPNGTLDNTNTRFWNMFGLPQPNDLGFLNTLLDSVIKNYNIDTNRIYSTGMSNGGFMSYELACKLSPRIAAIASVTGSMINLQQSTCTPTHPTPVLQIHGTNDATVSYSGTGGIIASLAIDSLVQYWVKFNQCNPVPVITNVPDIVTSDLCTAVHYLYQNGNKGSSVEFYKIIGGTHTWPGAFINLGVTNMDFSASKEIWRFFSQYTLNQLVTTINQPHAISPLKIYPNPSESVINLILSEYDTSIVDIFSIDGRLIHSFKPQQTETKINMPMKGIYIFKLRGNHQFFQQKILIQ